MEEIYSGLVDLYRFYGFAIIQYYIYSKTLSSYW